MTDTVHPAGREPDSPPDANRKEERAPSGRIRTSYTETPGLDRDRLEQELREAVGGEVRFDEGSLAVYSTDASNYRQIPIGVVVPKTKNDVIATVAICRRHRAPILARGGGTSLAGECCNTAVVIDFSKYMTRVLEIDPQSRTARVEPGCILDTLRDQAKKHGLIFGPDPATHDHNTLGGMIGNNSGGVHTLMNGITVYNVRALEVLTYDGLVMQVGPTSEQGLQGFIRAGGRQGEIYRKLANLRRTYEEEIRERFPKIPRRVSGYENLNQLFAENSCNVARALVGTEGTCVIVLEAVLDLIPNPKERVLAVIGFSDIFHAADTIPEVLKHKPIAVEGMDQHLVDNLRIKHLVEEEMRFLPEGCGWLLVEFGADTEDEAAAKAEGLNAALTRGGTAHGCVIRDKAKQAKIWKVRDSALGAESYVPNHPDTWPGWEDSAVHPDRLGEYLRALYSLFQRYGYDPCLYGHFGDGLVHCTVGFDLYDEPGIAKWRHFLEEASSLVVSFGGSLSGEHGDGQARGELLEKMYGADLVRAFREFKSIWDPDWRMNPGKVVAAYPITSDLRIGPSYQPPLLETYFSYPAEGSFDRAAQRCVGVGKCRRHDSHDEVMCPSYLATHEEKYTTRGRSRLLFEMLHGGPIAARWRSDAVEEALDLCLACKGCRSDCPVNVDMATYKAEFRAHHYQGRFRPRAAYSMGRIHDVARIASAVPGFFNLLTRGQVFSRLSKSIAGIEPRRRMPPLARESFTAWFRSRRDLRQTGQRVLLFPDTFNNYFRPETAIAATRALEAAGFRVTIPKADLCCGRPLYDWGWIAKAKSLWAKTFAVLEQEIADGTPVIGLEPACLAAFRDELPNLFPNHRPAQQLSNQSFFFSDFLADRSNGAFRAAGQRGKALVQIHCHQHAIITANGERKLLDDLSLDYEILASGCCGMAGSFGFERGKYDISQTLAERILLPAVRAADADTAILANGFSCREQIEQATGRKTQHIAEAVVQCIGLENVP